MPGRRCWRGCPQARLLLKGKPFADAATRALYLDRLAERGVAPERVELIAWLPDQAHLALYDRVDIALDPFPYNGTTTTCEALWMGVPVVTLRGDRHAGRVGASLLTQIGLTDLIADSVEEYVEIAVALAGDPARLSRTAPFAAAAHGGVAAVRRSGLCPQGRGRLPHHVAALVRGARPCCGRERAGNAHEPPQRRAAGKQGQPGNPGATATAAVPASADLFGAGLAHHQAGRLAEAEACYRRVLAAQPNHADALNMLGVLAHQMGRPDMAVDLIRRAIENNGNNPAYFCNLGYALRDQGQARGGRRRGAAGDPHQTRPGRGPFQSRLRASRPGQARRSDRGLSRSHPHRSQIWPRPIPISAIF